MSCTSDKKGETSNSRKSDDRKRETIGGRGPKSLSRRDVSGACELPVSAHNVILGLSRPRLLITLHYIHYITENQLVCANYNIK